MLATHTKFDMRCNQCILYSHCTSGYVCLAGIKKILATVIKSGGVLRLLVNSYIEELLKGPNTFKGYLYKFIGS